MLLSALRTAYQKRQATLYHDPLCHTAAKSKASAGWTPLHLASCFGHKDVVEELLRVS